MINKKLKYICRYILPLIIAGLFFVFNSGAQNTAPEDGYISIFDETDLYITESTRTRINPYEETNNIAGGYINFGISPTEKKMAPNQGNGVPSIPPTPDVPINRNIFILMITGFTLGIYRVSTRSKNAFL